jgi:hypothetical protein
MAKALGVPRRSVGYYMKAGGANRTQAAAIIGLVARVAARELRIAKDSQTRTDDRQVHLAPMNLWIPLRQKRPKTPSRIGWRPIRIKTGS